MISPKENPFYNLLFNIILPVILLNKGGAFLSPEGVLLTALAFPLVYGLKDYIQGRGVNFISLMGVAGVVLTGGLALLQMEGIFFAIKEAGVPLLIAVFILASLWMKKPALGFIFEKTPLFHYHLIQQKIRSRNKTGEWAALIRFGTLCLAASFVLSAVLNFFVAFFVFKDIDPSLPPAVQSGILNRQIADMTWMGYVFIALPLTLIMGALIFYILRRLKTLTGLKTKEALRHPFLSQYAASWGEEEEEPPGPALPGPAPQGSAPPGPAPQGAADKTNKTDRTDETSAGGGG